LAFTPFSRATRAIDAPGTSVASTIRRFSSAVRRTRFAGPFVPTPIVSLTRPSSIAACHLSTRREADAYVIVGEGDVGKTCLSRKIVDQTFDLQKNQNVISTTKGIDIREWHTATGITDDFKINVWDFGGQEIYHHTHQFFLTTRSLYMFVWDARREDRVEGFDYWLNVVKLLRDNSPILIVLNKADERIKEIDQKGLAEKFGNIVGFHQS
jgi:small GTP-binding protein